MNLISSPPIRENMLEETKTEHGDLVVLGQVHSAWVVWFSDVLTAINLMQGTGTTAQRPNPAPFVGFMYFDTTVGFPVWAASGTTWVKYDGTPA